MRLKVIQIQFSANYIVHTMYFTLTSALKCKCKRQIGLMMYESVDSYSLKVFLHGKKSGRSVTNAATKWGRGAVLLRQKWVPRKSEKDKSKNNQIVSLMKRKSGEGEQLLARMN